MSSSEIKYENQVEVTVEKDSHKDFRTDVMDNYLCDEYVFCSNFDSGNLRRAELVRKCTETEISDNIVHVEFNVWTTPDCYGTSYESPNRTWFFFSIRGGRPYRNVKINVKNLNRQSKLFGQGMQPVQRIGLYGKWERIKNKPTYNTEEENFTISFIHHTMDKCDIDHFYAFTYPFTYAESLNMLDKFDKKHQKNTRDINYIINRLVNTVNDGIFLIPDEPRKQLPDSDGNSTKISESRMDVVESSSSSSLEALKDSSKEFESIYEKMTQKELLNEIYYHREPLIKSLEGRRVDLLTITSFHGIKNIREEKLVNLFPDPQCLRCHTFKNKKIIFMSSRVHPGETPASFVLNGFLNLILDKKSIVAQTLRQLYVFKIVPILNPDGVYRGFYRTDTLGQNLNRMYMNPKLEIHPSIYAVKKLIKFYHFGFDKCEAEENFSETSTTSSSLSTQSEKLDMPMKDANTSSDEKQIFEEKQTYETKIIEDVKIESQSCSLKESVTSSESEEHIVKTSTSKTTETELSSDVKQKTFTEILIPEIKTISHEPSKKKSMNIHKITTTDNKIKKIIIKPVLGLNHGPSIRNVDNKLKDSTLVHHRTLNKRVLGKKEVKGVGSKGIGVSTSNKNGNKRNILSTHNSNTNLDFSVKGFNIEKSLNEDTNMFLYIDFHGHASKKGVFMYGNHFSNSSEAVECMLLPRLMSINCQHFHYDACNFSERNMYRREKRDGLSKEGSGRVAVFKMTGLIKSYTLESNYNMGKYVNSLPPRAKDNNHVKQTNTTPPKYTPAIFEEVGRALGPSILDITNSNALSRIQNSEFRTIQGLRITLRNEIERNYPHRHVTRTAVTTSTTATTTTTTTKALAAQQSVKRIKRNARSASSALPQNDTSKENKAIFNPMPCWETTMSNHPSTSMLLKSGVTSQTAKLQLKLPRSTKKTNMKVRPVSAPLYGTKDLSICKKKPKALTESSNSVIGKKDVPFFIPPKKVKVLNKINFKGTIKRTNISQKINNPDIKYLKCNVSDPTYQKIECREVSSPSFAKSESICSYKYFCSEIQDAGNTKGKKIKSLTEAQINPTINLPSGFNDKYYHCKSTEVDNICTTSSISNLSQKSSNTTENIDYSAVPSSSRMFINHLTASHPDSYRKSKKTESSLHVFKNPTRNNSNLNISSSSSSTNTTTSASSSNISSKNSDVNLKMKTFGGSGNLIKLRKKRINRHETMIIKRKKNKIKSTLH